jgi:hypothetical protein
MCEHGRWAFHTERHDGQNIRPKQLRSREAPWEGSHRSKLMSRRTERPYQVDGAGELARRSAARCSAPEINGPVVQQEFTFLLREACKGAPLVTAGAVASDDHRAFAGVSRGRSTESNEPGTPGGSHNSGRAELGRQTRPLVVLSRSDEADWLSYRAAITVAEKECCSNPQGLPGTAVRGPACTVVWELGGAIPPATRLGSLKGWRNVIVILFIRQEHAQGQAPVQLCTAQVTIARVIIFRL